jgi:hypothetical protein
MPGPRLCSTKRGGSAKLKEMRAKLLTAVCVLAVTICTVTPSPGADSSGPLTAAADAIVVRPVCLAATVVGSVLFVVALPWAAASKSVKKTANTLVVKPAQATFTRPLGDVDALKDE